MSQHRLAARAGVITRLHPALAHDVRSPLGGLMVNLELLRHAVAGTAPDQAPRRYVEAIAVEAGRMHRALSLLLAPFESQGAEGPFDLAAAVTEVGAWVTPTARGSRATVEVRRPDREIHMADGRDDVRQALLHLALRGLELAGPGARLLLELESDGGRALIRVGATGPGDPPAVGDRSSGDSDDVEMARALLEARGGRLAAEPGNVGNSWRIELPSLDES